ncbi:MAG: ABC transporter substrate-binding protein [Egibacteraceae bacterium]
MTVRTAPRWFVAMVIGALAAGLLAACGVQRDASSAPDPQGGGTTAGAMAVSEEQERPWTFTDDRGVRVSLESHPQRVVAYETAGSALWYLGIDPVGIFAVSPLAENPQLSGVDLSGIEPVGEVYGEINMEKMAALRPDLIVTAFDPDEPEVASGFADAGQQAQAQAIAPIVAIDGTKDPTAVIGRFEELAESLDADLNTPELVAARDRFDEAVEELRAAVASKPGLRALAIGAYDQLYFAKPAAFPALRQYQQWGLDLIEPGGDDPFWDIVSFEFADKYAADLILYDNRPVSLSLDDLAKIPTWRTLPAVEAGQLVAWEGHENWSFQLYAEDIELIAEAVKSANPDIVP